MNALTSLAEWGQPDSRFQSLLSVRVAALLGAVGAILSVVVADLPGVGLTLGCASVILLFTTYPVGALAWGNGSERAIEAAYFLVGLASAALAITADPTWLAFGWAMHGIWDALHHRDHHVVGLRGIPLWWVTSCLVWDFGAAIGLLIFV